MKKMDHTVFIKRAANGFTVKVGCQKFVFKDNELDEFLADLKTLMLNGSHELHQKYDYDNIIGEPQPVEACINSSC